MRCGLPSVLSMLVGLGPVASIDLQSLGASAPARWRSLVPRFDRSASFRAFKRRLAAKALLREVPGQERGEL